MQTPTPTSPILKIFAVLTFAVISLLQVGCGPVDVSNEKNYVFFIDTQDALVQEAFEKILTRLNQEVGLEAFTVTSDRNAANSSITFVEGLEKSDGKIGYGRYVRETRRTGPLSLNPKIKNKYSIEAEFDLDYVKKRATANLVIDLQMDLFKLVAHEIGHGLEKPHENEETALMYYNISGFKNFPPYFQDVHDYLSKV